MNFLSEYHPIRYNYHLKQLVNDALLGYENSSKQDIEKYGGLLLGANFEQTVSYFFSKEDVVPHGLSPEGWAQYKEEIFGTYISYLRSGENIFHIQPELLRMFMKTNVDDFDISHLNIPYSDFYMYFGDSRHYPISKNSYIDGAYIEFSKDDEISSLFINLTHCNTSIDFSDKSLGEFSFLKNDDHLLYMLAGEEGEKVNSLLKEAFHDIEIDSGFIGLEWKDHLFSVTRLVINCLCFLASSHNDLKTRFPSKTPKSFVRKYNRASTKKARDNSLKRIKSQGFTRINFLGDSVKSLYRTPQGISERSSSISPHWRRGHWRNQACGEKRAKNQLIWIKPTLVNRKLGRPKIKHLYDIKEEKG